MKTKKINLKTYKVPQGKVLILRSCNADMTSYNNFKYPDSGYVEAPDFKATKACGNGLHGFLKGLGDHSLANWSSEAKWLVLEVEENGIIDLNDKVKFKGGEIIYVGYQKTASQIIKNIYPEIAVMGSTATAGDRGTATAGDSGTATAGYRGTATAGDRGVLIIEYYTGSNYARKVALIGENGIKANVKYRLNSNNEFEEVKS